MDTTRYIGVVAKGQQGTMLCLTGLILLCTAARSILYHLLDLQHENRSKTTQSRIYQLTSQGYDDLKLNTPCVCISVQKYWPVAIYHLKQKETWKQIKQPQQKVEAAGTYQCCTLQRTVAQRDSMTNTTTTSFCCQRNGVNDIQDINKVTGTRCRDILHSLRSPACLSLLALTPDKHRRRQEKRSHLSRCRESCAGFNQ